MKLKFKNILYIIVPAIIAGGVYLKKQGLLEIQDSYIAIHFNKEAISTQSANQNKTLNNQSNDLNNISNDISNSLLVQLDYSHYSLQFNCDKGGFDYFEYTTVPDKNIDLERYHPFHSDKSTIQECGYTGNRAKAAANTATYKNPTGYDRGHGVHQNIWDHDKELMRETNYMSNIVPHESKQNRQGLWRKLEALTECYRDKQELYVIGGNIWGNDSSNDYFIDTHNVYTPDYLFKIIQFSETEIYSWVMPNNKEANIKNANNYLTSVSEIENLTGYSFSNINENSKNIVMSDTPKQPKGCNLK